MMSIRIDASVFQVGSSCRARSYERGADSNSANRRTRYVPSRFLSATPRFSGSRIVAQDGRIMGNRGLQVVDGDPHGLVLVLDGLDPLVPVKPTVRHEQTISSRTLLIVFSESSITSG